MGRILIVDDDPFYREGIKRVAGRVYEIETAASGAEGLHLLRHNGPFSVVVSDLKMVGMSGIEFLRELRKLPEGDQPLVVFCTTENDMAHIQEALAAGANEYIMKPFDSEIIETKFSQIGLL